MNATEEYIPAKTASLIVEPTPVGERHATALKIAISLIGQGIPPAGVFATLRSKFEPDVTDAELNGVIDHAVKKNPQPCHPRNGSAAVYRQPLAEPQRAPQEKQRTPIEQADWWTSGGRLSVERMVAKSPLRIPEDNSACACLAVGTLYKETEHLNIVCKFTADSGKANPIGGGKTMLREAWVKHFQDKGVPQSDAGAWFRINPCGPTGTGAGGSITDSDVTALRYLLIESDVLPLDAQLALFSRLRLPIAAVVLSGGASAHAWVKVDCENLEKYKETAARILSALKPFGVDQANKNPSRLSRLPGAIRTIGAKDGGVQRLLWLNPSVAALSADGLSKFEDSLRIPAIEEKPLLAVAQHALDRYEYMRQNKGKLGIPMGIPKLDELSGGMKPGQTIVVAGETGGGKSTFGLHIVNSALNAGYGVALFSLEMGRDEVFDLMVSQRSKVNRNKFNTGDFNDYDLELLGKELPKLASLPLYIEDSPTTSLEDARVRINQLHADGKIGLVVVDYIQFMNPGFTKDNREQQVATLSHGLRAMARETKLPFVVLSQLNDEGKIRESRVITHNANVVAKVEMTEITTGEKQMIVHIVKGRGIPCGDYTLDFDANHALLKAY